jgi:DNA-binding IclR family transcriptional regulator
METFADKLDKVVVNSLSPNRTVKVRLSGRDGITVRFAASGDVRLRWRGDRDVDVRIAEDAVHRMNEDTLLDCLNEVISAARRERVERFMNIHKDINSVAAVQGAL